MARDPHRYDMSRRALGSCVRRAHTAMGDAVKVASRPEGRTKPYGDGIRRQATRKRVKDVVFREIDRIRVKGKGRL